MASALVSLTCTFGIFRVIARHEAICFIKFDLFEMPEADCFGGLAMTHDVIQYKSPPKAEQKPHSNSKARAPKNVFSYYAKYSPLIILLTNFV